MKVVIYEENTISRAAKLLESVAAIGTSSFHALSELDNILKSGTKGNYEEDKKDGDVDAVDRKEVQSN